MQPGLFDRRAVLRGTIIAGGVGLGMALAACTSVPTPRPAHMPTLAPQAGHTGAEPKVVPPSRALLAYFSRAGENYYYGGRIQLQTGNTEVIAGMIGDQITVDTFRIDAADSYPDGYESTVQRNREEQRSNARPAIVGDLPDIVRYDTVLLGCGVWNVRAPMIMRTFVDALDFAGKSVHPFVTYAVSGMGNVRDDYVQFCAGASVSEGLAVQGEEAPNAGPKVNEWLSSIGLLSA